MQPIGTVRNLRTSKQDDHWGNVISEIELDATQFATDALLGIETFSHLQVVFFMDQIAESNINIGARHPRNNPDWPLTGIFAQRASGRPNRIGVSFCELIEVKGLTIVLRALDAIDGTPVLDIKPWMDEFAPRGVVRQPQWSHELMIEYYSN